MSKAQYNLKKINEQMADLVSFGITFPNVGDYNYVKLTLKEAFSAGKIEGLKEAIRIKEET